MTLDNIGHIYRFSEPKDTKVIKAGKVTIEKDWVTISDWHVKDMTLPELMVLAIEWAYERLYEVSDIEDGPNENL